MTNNHGMVWERFAWGMKSEQAFKTNFCGNEVEMITKKFTQNRECRTITRSTSSEITSSSCDYKELSVCGINLNFDSAVHICYFTFLICILKRLEIRSDPLYLSFAAVLSGSAHPVGLEFGNF